MTGVYLLPESQSTSPHYEETLKTLKDFSREDGVRLDGESLSIADVVAVAKKRRYAGFAEDKDLTKRADASVQALHQYLQKGYGVYGVNTGFGGSADSRTTNLTGLQTALLQTIQSGVLTSVDFAPDGANSDLGFHSMPVSWVRATMLVRCNHLLRGHSGVRYVIIQAILKLLNNNMTPIIPLRGSISASGDLMPMAYIAGVLEGNPDIKVRWEHDGKTSVISTLEALESVDLKPFTLGPKEGLGLLNGSAASAAVASISSYETNQLMILSQVIIGMSCEALAGNSENYHHFVAAIRPHSGQIEVARNIRHFLKGSKLVEMPETKDRNRTGLFQDRYALRGTSQWIGPQLEDMSLSNKQIYIELNSTQDNPVIDAEAGEVYSGCNFQAASITSAMEKSRLSLQMVGKLLFGISSELINPELNRGLPPNLCADDPSCSFHAKGVDINMAAYMSELAYLANPVSSHVQCAEMDNQAINSLALISSRYTMQSVELVSLMSAAHLYVVCQALDLRTLHNTFISAMENLVQTAAREFFDTMEQPGFEHLRVALFAAIRKSWTETSKENLGLRCQLMAEKLTTCVIATTRKHRLCAEHDHSPDIRAINLFTQRIQVGSETLYQSMRKTHLEEPNTAEFLGAASKRLYHFVRKELNVPFHRGYDEHPTNPASFGRERKTVGSWISIIYASIRDGTISQSLIDCFDTLSTGKGNGHSNDVNGSSNGAKAACQSSNGTNGHGCQ